ncbi:MAG: hypothetical protein SO532_06060 [Candidatus Borkfalkiaceae bacterium]|nr:hypothetical protein [Christensenellaceae bacterium]
MKKTLKKISIGVFALAAVCSLGGAIKTRCVQADAITNNTVETVAFQMEAGASIRLAEDGNGIRYRVKMPAAEHTALEANKAYSSVYYGILVAPADYEKTYGELNKANVFGIDKDGNSVEAIYDWAVKDKDGKLQYNGSKIRIMNFRTGLLTDYTAENGDKMAGYYGSIVDLKADNIVRNFVGVGYICYTDAKTGKTDYLFAERNDNIRSMAEVARKAIDSSKVNSDAKALLKEKYLENVYNPYLQFNTQASKQIVKGAALSLDSVGGNNYAMSALVKHDDLDASGESNKDTTTIGRQDLVIDMGGIYRVKEIESIAIRYRYLNDAKAADGTYISMNLNANGDKVAKNRLTDLEYNGENSGWYIAKKTENFATLTIPQSSLKANSLGGTLLSADDYLTSLSFAQPSWRPSGEASGCRVRMQIDSIEVKLVPQFKKEYLEFNTADSLDIVSGMDAKFVELENGKKAVQATFKNDALNDPNTTADDEAGTKVNFRINLGGIYKVAEIESIEISYKIISGDSALWWRVNLNDIYDENRRVTGVDYSSKTTSQGTPTAQFETIRISNEGLKTNKMGGSILSDEDYLTSLSFSNASSQTDLKFRCTMQIEYIRITLKGE